MRITTAWGAALLAPALALAPVRAEGERALADVTVRLEPDAHRLEATAVLDLRDVRQGEAAFELHGGLEVEEASVDGKAVPFEAERGSGPGSRTVVKLRLDGPRAGLHHYAIRYGGTIYEPPAVAQFSRERIADQTDGTVQAEGVFLSPSAAWTPRFHDAGFDRMRVEVRLPPGWEAVVEGHRKSRLEDAGGTRTVFDGDWPKDGIDLVAGRWKRFERDHGGITVAAYVFPDDADLAEPYVQAAEKYLDMYSAWFGPYAYDRFTVVENFFPTGYGMPGFTLLGREVMHLPFIIATSLGHEVAHNWWGNGVTVDESGGNWCEGLTTYVADYHYKELLGPAAAADYRREMARDYTSYVSEPGRDLPLSAFTERSTPATRAVGYGKSMMVFHMLEQRIGKERVDAVLRRVYATRLRRTASWDTWRAEFSSQAGEDLGWFFDQWVKRTGAPSLALDDVRLGAAPRERGRDDESAPWRVTGTIRQTGTAYRIRVPLVFASGDRTERRTVEIDGASASFAISLAFRPDVVRVDPDQDVFRRLDPAEMPPVLSLLLGDPRTLFVVDDAAGSDSVKAYREIAATLTRTGEGEVRDASKVDPAALADRSVFLLGLPGGDAWTALASGLPEKVRVSREGFAIEGTEYREAGSAVLAVGRKAGEPSRGVAVFLGLSPDAIRAAGRKLVHYGKYSFLAFVDGNNRAKGVAEVSDGPLVHRFAQAGSPPGS